MAIRSERESLFAIGVASNRLLLLAVAVSVALHLMLIYVPALQKVFGTEALSPQAFAVACGLAAAGIRRRRDREVGDPAWLAVSGAECRAGVSRRVGRTGSPSCLRAYHRIERPPELKLTFMP